MLSDLLITFQPAFWWLRKAIEINLDAKWVPQNISTLIIGAEFDAITPFSLFTKDKRFDRNNITKCFIRDAGHFPWLDQPEEVKEIFRKFLAHAFPHDIGSLMFLTIEDPSDVGSLSRRAMFKPVS
jgi:pimeloyl-ACP methyl ester carboxylesterase